jgi:phage FluMu protein Com
MKKEIECPWCSKLVSPRLYVLKGKYGDIKERKCPECNGILAAYLDEKGTVLEKVRTFQN